MILGQGWSGEVSIPGLTWCGAFDEVRSFSHYDDCASAYKFLDADLKWAPWGGRLGSRN